MTTLRLWGEKEKQTVREPGETWVCRGAPVVRCRAALPVEDAMKAAVCLRAATKKYLSDTLLLFGCTSPFFLFISILPFVPAAGMASGLMQPPFG